LVILHEVASRVVHYIVIFSTPSPKTGKTLVKYTKLCFPPTHPYAIIFVGRHDNLSLCGSIKKFIDVSFFAQMLARLKISKTRIWSGHAYLKFGISIQWVVCSQKVSRHALRHNGQTSSLRNNKIIMRYLRIVRYSSEDMCWSNSSMRIAKKKNCCIQTLKKIFFVLWSCQNQLISPKQFYQKKNIRQNMLGFRQIS
jgi:hypothetical protein